MWESYWRYIPHRLVIPRCSEAWMIAWMASLGFGVAAGGLFHAAPAVPAAPVVLVGGTAHVGGSLLSVSFVVSGPLRIAGSEQ